MERNVFPDYVVGAKFSMDPEKRKKIFSNCKKSDKNLNKRKREILEKYVKHQQQSETRADDLESSESSKGQDNRQELQEELQAKSRYKKIRGERQK